MWQYILLWLLLVALAAGVPEEHQYCAIRYRRLCQGKGRHIACQFPDPGPGSSCERYTQIKFTSDLKHFITHYLNRRRQRIASGNERVRGGVHLPKPQIMMLVEWDRELALLAQRLADQCHFVHDDCRATVKYPYAGQTVGEVRWRRSSESDELSAQRAIRRVLDAWWGERRRVQAKQLTSPFRLTSKGTVWGHFSQLAVWNLQAVGCGAVRHGARHPRLLLVCDFSHTNMLGQRTLVPGSMAPCPIHTARRPRTAYPALCGPVRHPSPPDAEESELEDNYDDADSEDSNDSETVEVGDVPTPSLWLRKTKHDQRPTTKETTRPSFRTTKEFVEEPTRKLDTALFRVNSDSYAVTMTPDIPKEPIRLDMKPNREREMELKARKKAMYTEDRYFNPAVRTDWPAKRKYYDKPFDPWHQHQNPTDVESEIEQVIPLTAQDQLQSNPPNDPRIVEMYRPTVREDNGEASETETVFRQRWKQTRVRPQRPGANALLYTTTDKQSKKQGVASIRLDKEDTDQFFRDTGFNLQWRKQTT